MSRTRNVYKWGIKEFLAEMEIGEKRADDGRFVWHNVQVMASRFKQEYGCIWQFSTNEKGERFVTRIA